MTLMMIPLLISLIVYTVALLGVVSNSEEYRPMYAVFFFTIIMEHIRKFNLHDYHFTILQTIILFYTLYTIYQVVLMRRRINNEERSLKPERVNWSSLQYVTDQWVVNNSIRTRMAVATEAVKIYISYLPTNRMTSFYLSDFDKTIKVKEGTCIVYLKEGSRVELRKGQSILIEKEREHAIRAMKEGCVLKVICENPNE